MREGDLVRFAKWEDLSTDEISKTRSWNLVCKNHIGTLIKHDKLMGTAHVLYGGEVLQLRVVFVEKAGKKDV
jgi:hypothetical protein